MLLYGMHAIHNFYPSEPIMNDTRERQNGNLCYFMDNMSFITGAIHKYFFGAVNCEQDTMCHQIKRNISLYILAWIVIYEPVTVHCGCCGRKRKGTIAVGENKTEFLLI